MDEIFAIEGLLESEEECDIVSERVNMSYC